MVVNSSVVIALAEIGLMNIMALLVTEILIPHAVYEEVVVEGRGTVGQG